MGRFRKILVTSQLLLCVAFPLAVLSQNKNQNGALPNATELMQRAIENEKKLADEQERYECRVADEAIQTDNKGNVKKTETSVKDQFFVNGIAI